MAGRGFGAAAAAILLLLVLAVGASSGVRRAPPEVLTVFINEKVPVKTVFDAKKRYRVEFSGTITFSFPGEPPFEFDALFHGPCSSPSKTTNVLLTDSRGEILAPHVKNRNIACRADHEYVVIVNDGPRPDLVGRVTASTQRFTPDQVQVASGAFTVDISPAAECRGNPATIVGEDQPIGVNRIFGTRGNDVIVGTDDNDLILGGGGRDKICALGDADRVDGGGGGDAIDGGGGVDTLIGGVGEFSDTLYGGNAADILVGGAGDDFLLGGAGDDDLFGRAGDDIFFGGRGADLLDGGADYDKGEGGPGIDTCKLERADECER